MVNAKASTEKVRKVFGILVRVYGTIFLLATVCTLITLFFAYDFQSNASRVDGHVVRLNLGSKGQKAPVVRFQTAGGETLEMQSYLHSSATQNVGDTVKVLYRSSNPKDWQIDDWIHLYFWVLMSSIFMFAWGIATLSTKLIGDALIRKREHAGSEIG